MRTWPWLSVDELRLGRGQRLQGGRQVISQKADVVEALVSLGEKASDPALRIDRLDELDERRGVGPGWDEAEAHPLGGEDERVAVWLEAEELPVTRQRVVDRAHDDRDVMDGPDGHGRCSPHTLRRAPAISPTVTPASTADRIRGTTFSVPAAAAVRALRASAAAGASRPARTDRVRSTWRASSSGSMAWGAGRCSSPSSVKAFTPTITRSPDSMARCVS